MSRRTWRRIQSALLIAAVQALAAPAFAQDPPSPPAGQAPADLQSLLWTSWSQQVSTVAFGSGAQVGDSTDLFGRPSGRECKVASTVGFAAGLVADALWTNAMADLLDLSPRMLFHDAPEVRTLSRVGETVGPSLFCPSPLARTDWRETHPRTGAGTTQR